MSSNITKHEQDFIHIPKLLAKLCVLPMIYMAVKWYGLDSPPLLLLPLPLLLDSY